MLNDISIVTTAISSFNNAALFNPYFLSIALLSLPLFYISFVYGCDILSRLKWNNHNIKNYIGFWNVLCLAIWMLSFGGNYAVIRDGISLLPVMVSVVLFVSVLFVVRQSIQLNYLKKNEDKKTEFLAFIVLVMFSVLSAMPNLYGVLLQVSAVLCGMIVGCRIHKNISSVVLSTLVFGTTTTLILMQPEFFRFGQLGNLTLLHLAALLFTGFFAVTTFVTKYVKARSKIYESAYVKLKWLFRIMALLALVLFVSTESVPVFVGLLVMIAMLQMLNIIHSKRLDERMSDFSWAWMFICFGVLIMCPVISCLGLVYISQLPKKTKFRDFFRLL